MKDKTEHGPDNLPIDSIVLTYGFGAEPVKAVVLENQRLDGTYNVHSLDSKSPNRIHAHEIVSVCFRRPINPLSQLQKEYDAKLAELDRIIAENNAKLAANHLAMQSAIADAQAAISTAIEKLKQ